MSIVLFGAGGMQGRAALYDLSRSSGLSEIVAADCHPEVVEMYLQKWSIQDEIIVAEVNADDARSISNLIRGAEVVIDLLPHRYALQMIKLAVENGVNLVNATYVVDPRRMSEPEIKAILNKLDDEAKQAGVTILRECGLDPGIDLLMCGQAARELDEIYEVRTYGSGFPEAEAANNPLKYKITWTFDGVLESHKRGGRYLQDGVVREFAANEMFAPKHVHLRDFPPFGELESYPNGDSLALAEELGIRDTVRSIGRFVSRWPGHAPFWYRLVNLGFLNDEPIRVGKVNVSPKAFLISLLEPQLQLASNERDVTFALVEMEGLRDGKPKRISYEMIDRRDLETGFFSMQRTVGFTASIAAQFMLEGAIDKKGLISPLNDVPYKRFVQELENRGIKITRREE